MRRKAASATEGVEGVADACDNRLLFRFLSACANSGCCALVRELCRDVQLLQIMLGKDFGTWRWRRCERRCVRSIRDFLLDPKLRGNRAQFEDVCDGRLPCLCSFL